MCALVLFAEGIPGRAQPVGLEAFAADGRDATWQSGLLGPWACRYTDKETLPGPLYLCGVCTSSLDMANFFAQQALLPVWGSVLVSGQTAGRGQLGRSWHSPSGNLFAAVRLPGKPPFDGTAAAPAVGAFVTAGLRQLGYPVWFKWPNDIAIVENGQTRKVCGILLEERRDALVAGIGINFAASPPAEAMREGHAMPGGCLGGSSLCPGTLSLWEQLVSGIKFCYEQNPPLSLSENSGLPQDNWRSAAEAWLLYKARPVAVLDGPDNAVSVRGLLKGIAPDGGLCIQTRDGLRILHSGSLIPE